MTSYANDTTTTAAAPATTTTNTGNAAAATTAAVTVTTPAADNKQMSSNNSHRYDEDDNSSLDGREKADTTPENIKKIAEIISDKEAATTTIPTSPTQRLQQQQQQQFVGLGAAIDESNVKFCLGKPPPSPAEKATLLSRAHHNHHQSNISSSNKDISGADEDDSTQSTATTKTSLAFTIDHFEASENDAAAQAARYKTMMERFQSRHRRGASMSKLETETTTTTTNGTTEVVSAAATPTTETAATPVVKMRVRDRSASRVRDASKRHSWSPRSSGSTTESAVPRATNRTKAQLPPQPAPPKGTANLLANRTSHGQFTPRSTAMQMALQQVELLCPHPPLDDLKQQQLQEEDAVSEAGTYTLDGDNYTEEQKDLMNIDRNAAAAAKLRPKQLAVKSSRASNVLEVNYYHETPSQEHKGGVYLDQLKSRVQRQQQPLSQQQQQPQAPPTPPSPRTPAADVGCFTSVTTSGVLAKQRALDTHPKLMRHSHSLSTSQIDSSEYVSNEAKLKHAQAMAASATDRQKAEYRLNVFTSQQQQQQQHQHQHHQQHQQHQHHQLPETPTTPTMTEAALLQSAPTKQDWIQEWARNARARSLAQDVSSSSASRRKQQAQQQAQLMTRSYNCSDTNAGADSLTDDSLSLYSQHQRQFAAKLDRNLAERYRLLVGDCDYASDPALCSHGGNQGHGEPYKPPKSPSKIPSPLHTLGRARSASRSSRPSINEQQQHQQQQLSSSRRSSVKSPATQCSPQHSLETGYRRSPLHRALMTSSINEAQLQLLTSGEYLLKQLHRRKNSLDDVEHEHEHELPSAMLSGSISPLRRSSSFQQQQRPLQTRQARPNFQNLYTPPAARHSLQQQQQQLQHQQQLKKSASSNNFEQSYSDYDNELQYYINDEDELGTTGPYYSSCEEEEEQNRNPHPIDATVPLSNTRLNKALLMRIERSKQRVAGTGTGTGTGSGHTPAKPSSAPAGKLSVGLVACPNTPELPRRGIKSATRAASNCGPKLRQSMPRETSLSRLAQQVPSSLANAKKQLLQTANATVTANHNNPRVQPKYLDISKYKSAQSNNFLRKNDAKSTLKPAEQMKRSPSASSMGLTRNESTRTSNRSVRSTVSAMNTSTTSLGGGGAGARGTSAARRDASINKQKEAEMVMWKRRSTYDPMKAAAEDRRRKEEARRAQSQSQSQSQSQTQQDQFNDSNDAPFERPSRSHYRRGHF